MRRFSFLCRSLTWGDAASARSAAVRIRRDAEIRVVNMVRVRRTTNARRGNQRCGGRAVACDGATWRSVTDSWCPRARAEKLKKWPEIEAAAKFLLPRGYLRRVRCAAGDLHGGGVPGAEFSQV